MSTGDLIIQLSQEHFDAASAELAQLRESLLEQKEVFNEYKRVLLNNWKGLAYSPADSHIDKLEDGIFRLIAGLSMLKSEMESARDVLEDADRQSSVRMSGFMEGEFLNGLSMFRNT
jgi:uncharacterized protein YukE